MPFTLCHPAIVLPLHRYGRGLTWRWYARSAPLARLAPLAKALSVRQRWLALGGVAAAAALGGIGGLMFRIAWRTERAVFNVVATGMAAAAVAIVALYLAWKFSAGSRARTS